MSFINQFRIGRTNIARQESPFNKTDFPIFSNNEIVWFDNGATTQKPSCVINYLKKYYERYNSNIHRSPHKLSLISSNMFDESRSKVAEYIKCAAKEIVFVRGTTEGINFLANSINFSKLGCCEYSTILLTNMEHHSNIVPWQLLGKRGFFNLEYLFYDKITNEINLTDLENALINNCTIKVVSIAHVSNVLGIINPIKEIAAIVHKYNRLLIVDGAQGISHLKVDVKELGCDAYVFSSHKLFGPTGVGVVYCNNDLYNYLEPWQGGGSMIKEVTLYTSTYQDPPHKYEAGTPNIADVIAFGKTLDYLKKCNWDKIIEYEKYLTEYLYDSVKKIPNVSIIGDTIINKVPICSFVIPDVDDQALLDTLNKYNIAIRFGHHCAQPIIRYYGYENVYRISLAPYNTTDEIDYFVFVVNTFLNSHKKEQTQN